MRHSFAGPAARQTAPTGEIEFIFKQYMNLTGPARRRWPGDGRVSGPAKFFSPAMNHPQIVSYYLCK
jgi:hypothetical protein